MTNQSDIIASAREWIGTPFVHQGRKKGIGVDCAGVVVGIARDNHLAEGFVDPTDYPANPTNRQIEDILDTWMDRVKPQDVQPGDVLFFRYAKLPQHMGVLTEKGTFVHAYKQGFGVVEVTYDKAWRRMTVRGYRFREIVPCLN